MILHPENWMNIRKFRALHEAGASYAEIAAEVGCDWRTVKKYLSGDVPAVPPAGSSRKGTQPRKIASFEGVIDSWLRADIRLRASVICERLAAGYGYDGSYQRVKLYVAGARPKIAAELAAGDDNPLAGLHRPFAVAAGTRYYTIGGVTVAARTSSQVQYLTGDQHGTSTVAIDSATLAVCSPSR
jgi:hypothetical protein